MRSTGFEQSLHDGACHLWHWRPAAFEGRLRERALSFLSPEELARHSRYLVPQPGRTFLAARVFLRSVLSIYHPLPPRSWQFETNPWGRPRVTNLGPRNRFDFNLSHKPGQVTCLVGYGRDLGVDVEDAAANRPYLFDIADRFFSSSEAAGLRALPPPNQLERFYELWTLKESYIKARGIGLSLGLSRFSFSITGSQASVRFDDGFDDDASSWEFQLFRPDGRHLIATSVRRLPQPLIIETFDASGVVFDALG